MSKCTQCGFQSEDKNAFCPICGVRMPEEETGFSEQPFVQNHSETDSAETSVISQNDPPLDQPAQMEHIPLSEQPVSDQTEQTETPAAEAEMTEPSPDTEEAYSEAQTSASLEAPPVDMDGPQETGYISATEEIVAPSEPEEQKPRPGFCPQCGNRILPGGAFCAVCGARAAAAPSPPATTEMTSAAIAQPQQTWSHPQDDFYSSDQPAQPVKKKRGKIIAIVVVIVVVVAAGIAGAAALLSGSGSGSRWMEEYPIVYLQDDETLKFKTSQMEKAQTVTGAYDAQTYYDWELGYTAMTSYSGRYLLYLNDYRHLEYSGNGKGDLYLRDMSVVTPDGQTDRGTRIATDVTIDFYFTTNDRYVFYITTNGDLYAWDFNESWKLDNDVAGILDWNDSQILYYKGDEQDYYTSYFSDRDVYVVPVSENGRDSRIKIDTNISDLYDWNEDFTSFIYTKSSKKVSDDNFLFDLYSYDTKADKRETMVTEISEIVDANAEDLTAIYLVAKDAEFSFEDLIDDDMADIDAEIEDPDLDNYPLLSMLFDDLLGYFSLSSLYEYSDFDFAEFLESFVEYYGSDLSPAEQQQLDREVERFLEEMELYEGKAFRDELRKRIEDQLKIGANFEIGLFDMYMIKDGEREKLDSNIYQSNYEYTWDANADLRNNWLVYIKTDPKKVNRVRMSELTDTGKAFSFDADDFLSEYMQLEMYYAVPGETPKQLAVQEKDTILNPDEVYFTDDMASLYYLIFDTEDRSERSAKLYYCELDSSGTAQDGRFLDDGVAYFLSYNQYNGQRIYLKDRNGDLCDLYVVKGDQKDRICYDISYSAYSGAMNDGKTLYYFEEFDTQSETGDFYIQTDDKIRISDDTYDFFYVKDDLIYVWKNYRYGKGDLYVYDGEALKLVDYDVTRVFEYQG